METPKTGSAPAGSPIVPTPNPNDLNASGKTTPVGETKETGGEKKEEKKGIDEKAYADLESRLGSQGQELGEYRTFFQNIAPLLDKLDQSPELVQAIVDGKVDKDIAKAVLEGRVDVRDAAVVQQAQEKVKEKMGEKAFDLATPETVTKLVEKEVSKFRKEFEEKADLESFQEYSQKFIEKTKDFQEYADEIDKWLDKHNGVTDIEVAYYAVKGQMSEKNAQKVAEEAAAERAKEVMANASGGGQTAQATSDGTPIVDRYIAGRPNPNSFLGG